MESHSPVIGIDLGTTNSVVAVIENGEHRVIVNQEGHPKTPSVIAFTDAGEVIVGEIARRQAATQPQRTVSSVKRLIGRFKSDIDPAEEPYPFELGEDDQGRVTVLIDGRPYLPEELSALVLKKLKAAAEDDLGAPVSRVVLTVPAYFDDMQRQATLEAARLAGLDVLRLLNEPTAAAMAYGLGREDQQVVAVYDFGGGTFDFSVLEIDHKTFEVLVSRGNSRLGGDDIDTVIVDWVADAFERDTGLDLRRDLLTLRRLKDAAEAAKCELSTAEETLISLPFIAYRDGQPLHLKTTLTRDQLEAMIEPLVQETLDCCARALREAGIKKNAITRVILVGGSTRIPLVQDYVEDFFGIPPFKGINPDEIVAIGAATQGAIMNGELEEVVLLDVTPHCLGIEIKGNRKSVIVEKNSTIPIKVHKTFTTTEDNQTFVNIHALQGDSDKASECRSLGKFTLAGIAPAPAGVPRIRVMFHVNADGIVEISATDLQSGAERSLTIHHAYLARDERTPAAGHESRRHRRRRKAVPGRGERRSGAAAESPAECTPGVKSSAAVPPAVPDAEEKHEALTNSFAEVKGDTDKRSEVPTPRMHGVRREGDGQAAASGTGIRRPPTVPPTRPIAPAGSPACERLPIAARLARLQAEQAAETCPREPASAAPTLSHLIQATEAELPEPTPAAGAVAAVAPPQNKQVGPPDALPEELRPLADRVLSSSGEDGAAPDPVMAERFVRHCRAHMDDLALQVLLARFYIQTKQAEEAREVLDQLKVRQAAPAGDLLELYGRLVEAFPNYLAARRDRAALAAAHGDYATAMQDLEFVFQRENADDEIADRLIQIYQLMLTDRREATIQFKLIKLYLRKQQLDSAISLLQQLVNLPDYRDRANKVLGLCFWQKGMRYLAWQKFRSLPMDEEMKDILYRLATDMEQHDELLHANYALQRIYESDIAYRDVEERLKKIGYRLELQKDERYGGMGGGVRTPTQLDKGGPTMLGTRFEIIKEINRGSMGIVYKARDRIVDEIVAIKVLNDFLCTDPQAVERFRLEARSARKLTHQNIVRIHDMFEIDNKKIISMEYIEGENLKTMLARHVTFTEDLVLTFLVQICEGLAYAHRLQVVHRDIKPANIMINDRNQIKITDFGIAKLLTDHQTKAGTIVMGTPLYMAPEQIEGGKIDHRCDIYSLGIMMYEMVCGQPPFHEGNIEYQHIHCPPPEISVGVSDRLRKIIMKCIQKNPADRFQSVEEILTRII